MLMRLKTALDDEDRAAVRTLLNQLMGSMVVKPTSEGVTTIYEELAEHLLYTAVGESLGVVAGAGFEPTTFGL